MFFKQKILFYLSLLFSLVGFSAMNGFATPNILESPQAITDATQESEQFKLTVKLKPDIAFKAEAALDPNMTIRNVNHHQMALLFQKYKIRRMTPLNENLVRWKKKNHQSEREYNLKISQKYPQRAMRYQTALEDSEIPDISRTYSLEINVKTKREFDAAVELLKTDPNFEYVERDLSRSIQLNWREPNDPYFSSRGSWGQSYDDLHGIKEISCPVAWESLTQKVPSTGTDIPPGTGVTVAVIDTGVDKGHPDIASNIWINNDEKPGNGIDDDENGYTDDGWGYNFIDGTNTPIDDNGHGSHVAGTIAAVGNNNTGVIGVAPGAKIMALKVLDNRGRGSDQNIYKAIVYAVDNGADVINMSFGGRGVSQALEEAVKYAYGHGVVMVVAAGNDHEDVSGYSPAGFHDVITVSALDAKNGLASFSNIGREVDVAAPGVDILSLRAAGTSMGSPTGDFYTRADGTSMAAPHVSGLAALILSAHKEEFTAEQVRQVICNSADDIFNQGVDIESGYGKINAAKAMDLTNVLEVHLQNFASSELLEGRLPINGTVKGANLSSYSLEYGIGVNPSSWTPIFEGSTPVEAGELGVLDTSIMPDGIYSLRLVARDNTGKLFTDYLEFVVHYTFITDPASPVQTGAAHMMKPGKLLSIHGTMERPALFQRFRMEWGEGLEPTQWYPTGFELTGEGYTRVKNGLLARWDSNVVPQKSGYYQIRLLVEYAGFTDEARTSIYLEPELLTENWPQKLTSLPANNVLPARAGDGKSSLVLNLSDPSSSKPAFCRYSYDGTLQYDTDYRNAFYGQLAVGNLDGNPGDEALFTRDSDYIRIVKPDNTYMEFAPELTRLKFQLTPMMIQDLDGDFSPEILAIGNDWKANNTKYLFAWSSQGKLMSGYNPILIKDREDISIKPKVRFLAVDLDRDRKKELLVAQEETRLTSSLKLYGWDGQPRNWPVEPIFPDSLITNMMAGDLDHDGWVELLVTTIRTTASSSNQVGDRMVYLLGADGSIKPGWPMSIPLAPLDSLEMDAGLADMNRNGDDEIVISTTRHIYVLTVDGKPLSGNWPFSTLYTTRRFLDFSIGDINGDAFPEILVAQRDDRNFIYGLAALDYQGKIIKSWTIPGVDGQTADLRDTEPLIGDFDANGKVDIALSFALPNKEGGLVVLTQNADYNPQYMDWPMVFHDPQNTSVGIQSQTQPVKVLNRIQLDASRYSLQAGLTGNITVTGIYNDGSTENLTNSATYQIADPGIATVDATGMIRGLAPGSTVLTASYQDKTATAQVTVEQPDLLKIELDTDAYSIGVGTSKNVRVTASYADASTKDVTSVATYHISDTAIATVDYNGVIRGVAPGTTMLTVNYMGKNRTVPVVVEQRQPELTGIALDATNWYIPAGMTVNLTVTATYSDNSKQDITTSAKYQIADTSIVTMASNGNITGLAPGKTTLTVTYQGYTVTGLINVTQAALIDINLDMNTYSITAGTTKKVSVTATYADNSTRNMTGSATYQIADTQIATVDSAGVIHGVSPGTTILTVSFEGKTKTVAVVVEQPQPKLVGIRLNGTNWFMPVGTTVNITVTATSSDNSTKDVTIFAKYQIANPKIAEVTPEGLLKALTSGTTIVTVSYEGKTIEGTIHVN